MVVFQKYSPTDQVLTQRVQEVMKQVSAHKDIRAIYKQILGLIDLTTLSGDDTNERIRNLCLKARQFSDPENEVPHVAAVCIYPVFAALAHDHLVGTGIKTACVAGGFPSGQSPLEVRVAEVAYAVAHGAEEIDMVISRGKLIEGDEAYISREVSTLKKACKGAHLKVILETGELLSTSLVRKASELAILAGADFIKTSTGKIQPAATPEAFLVMLDTIKEYHLLSGKMVGIKPAGGISEPEEALLYYSLVKQVLGENWLTKDYFRIGASRLADKIDALIHSDL